MPSADKRRLGDGTACNAERLKLDHSAISYKGFGAASDAIENAPDATENASGATKESHSLEPHEEIREPAPTVDEQGRPRVMRLRSSLSMSRPSEISEASSLHSDPTRYSTLGWGGWQESDGHLHDLVIMSMDIHVMHANILIIDIACFSFQAGGWEI